MSTKKPNTIMEERYMNAKVRCEKYLKVINEVLDGNTEDASCKNNDVSKGSLRKFINSTNKRQGYEEALEIDILPKLSWPDNLVSAICGEEAYPDLGFTEIWDAIKYEVLTEREVDIIEKMYLDRMRFSEIAKYYSLSESRIVQIHTRALRKLRSARVVYPLLYGKDYIAILKSYCNTSVAGLENIDKLKGMVERLDEHERCKKATIDNIISNYTNMENERIVKVIEENKQLAAINTPITHLGLSTRSYNALIRYTNCKTAADIMNNMSIEKLHNIRNLGDKSIDEICNVMKEKYDFDIQ